MPLPQLPITESLREADPSTSLQDYLSRDPEGFQSQDRTVIINSIRQMRERLLEAAEAGTKAPRATRVAATPNTAADPDNIQ